MTQTAQVTLTDFLLARIAEDEAVARAAYGNRWRAVEEGDDVPFFAVLADRPQRSNVADAVDMTYAEHIARWDPERVLAEVDAKRRIVEAHAVQWAGSRQEDSVQRNYMSKGRLNGLWTAVQLLALPYAEHPDFREEWRV